MLSETALFAYKCTDVYDPACELSVVWNDPAIGIQWPVDALLLSPRDAAAPRLSDIDPGRLPRYAGSGG